MNIEQNSLTDNFSISDYRAEKLKKQSITLYSRNIACEYLLIESLRRRGYEINERLNIYCNSDGKPYIAGNPLFFSLSHSDELVACAVADAELGLDIQKNSKYNHAVARRYFSKEELDLIHNSDNEDKCFTMLWCAKESYIKAIGSTVSKSLSTAHISFDASGQMYCNSHKIIKNEIADYLVCCCSVSEQELQLNIRELII